jgi:predicted alpha/beta superfamily hydrolase
MRNHFHCLRPICRRNVFVITSCVVLALSTPDIFAAPTDDAYTLGPDSLPHDGVPKGKITGPKNIESKVFPGTSHMFTVYVPAQYEPAQPACLMIFQDGHAYADLKGEYRIPNVFDNLIYRREMPVTIAVFINPGHGPDQPDFSPSNWDANSNRPQEYNELTNRYARVILDELMPELKKDYNITDDPDGRALSGASSGAIAAFTVAWQRPDQFHKVITTIGSFTAIRGGDIYPSLISQSDKKPIRIFLEDGINDNRGVGGRGGRGGRGSTNTAANADTNVTVAAPALAPAATNAYNPGRDWHTQNIKMVKALAEKGYDVNYAWTLGTHSNKHGGALMPEMLRWLWRDYERHDSPTNASNRTFLVPAEAPASEAVKPAQ